MIWVIQKWINGAWHHHRHPNGMPMMFDRKSTAQIALRDLPPARYRIILVRD